MLGIHNGRNAIRNHSEVLAADKHVGGIDERRKFPHGFAIPEIIVTMIEEISVKTVVAPTLIISERTINVGELSRDARMIHIFLVRVLDEKNFINKS
jgi:hypothetical protein